MTRLHESRFRPLLIMSAAVLLRGIVPAGYMPAAAGSGFLFEFCPEGVPAGFMQVLSGNSGHDHHDHGGGDGEDDGHHCPIGHLLLSAAAVDDTHAADVVSAPGVVFISPGRHFTVASRTSYEPRGPPA